MSYKDTGTGTGASLQQESIIIPKNVLEKAMSDVLSRLKFLEEQVEILKESKEVCVPDSEAKKIVLKAIDGFKSAGVGDVDIIDLHEKTRLPVFQINEIMDDLEKDGKVSEYGEDH